MLRKVLHSKIHMGVVTRARPDYVGSLTVDAKLLEMMGLRASDAVLVANCRNGERFETYIFRGEPGSGALEVNGAAAHLVEEGDQLIVLHFALMSDEEYAKHKPTVLIMNEDNSVKETIRYRPG